MVRNCRLHLTRHYMMLLLRLCYANFNLHYIKTYVIIYISVKEHTQYDICEIVM